jgi:hypothetical protein
METSEQGSEAWASPPAENRPPTGVLTSSRILRPRDLQRYRACDAGTAGLIYFMVVFSPWAFGTTQPWAIRTMDPTGYLLGLLLALKLWVRWRKGYRPARWGRKARNTEGKAESRKKKRKGKKEEQKARLRDHETTEARDPASAFSPQPSAFCRPGGLWSAATSGAVEGGTGSGG